MAGSLPNECILGLDQSTNHCSLVHGFGGQQTKTEFDLDTATKFSKLLEIYHGPRGHLFEL